MPSGDAADLPDVPAEDDRYGGDPSQGAIENLLRDHWGLSGQLFPVDGTEGTAFLVDNGHLRYLLDIRGRDEEDALRLEHRVMNHVIRQADAPSVPEPVATRQGLELLITRIDDTDCCLRLLTALDNDPPPIACELSTEAISALGSLSAQLAKCLDDFEEDEKDLDTGHPDTSPHDDPRKAGPRAVALLSEVTDQEARDQIARALVSALRRLHPLAGGFRFGLTIRDLHFEKLAGRGAGKIWLPTGITDLHGVSTGWYVNALADVCAHVLDQAGDDPRSILPAITAYHDVFPLTADEAQGVWPLVIAQLALEAAEAENSHALSPEDALAAERASNCRRRLAKALSIETPIMQASIVEACRMALPLPEFGRLLPSIDPDRIRPVDLSVTSPLLYDGNWTDPDCDWKLLARVAWETGIGTTRYGEYRLSRSHQEPRITEAANFALHIDICAPAATAIHAPFKGVVVRTSASLSLRGPSITLLLDGAETNHEVGTELEAGDVLGIVSGADGSVGGLRVRLSRDHEVTPPLFCTGTEATIWQHLAPSPAGILDMNCNAPAARPGHLARGWREFLYEESGTIRFDFSGYAPLIGHGHPSVATAAYRQHLLSTAPEDDQSNIQALRDALADIAPPELQHVVLFVDPPSAMAALCQLARKRTGRSDIMTFEDDVDGQEAQADVIASDKIAAVIFEPILGEPVFNARAAELADTGSVIIADERRTGYGRSGDTIWASERQTINVDLVITGSCDGGRLTAVFCGRELADELAAYATIVSPIDIATASAALMTLQNEGMLANAAAAAPVLLEELSTIAENSAGMLQVDGSGLLWVLQPMGEFANLIEELMSVARLGQGRAGSFLIAPPLCLTKTSLDTFLAHLRRSLSSDAN